MEIMDFIIDFSLFYVFDDGGHVVFRLSGSLHSWRCFNNLRITWFAFDVFSLNEFFNFAPRIWGFAAENLVLVALLPSL